MTVLGALTRREPRNAIQVTPWGDWSDTSSKTASGANVTVTSSLQLLTVYGCNRFIADGISTLPVDVLRRQADGSPVPIRTPPVIAQPAIDLNFTSWATQIITSLLLAGNAYVYIVRSAGQIVELLPLDPTKVTVDRRNNRKVFTIDGREFNSFEVGHIPGVMWPGSDVGLSPVEAARQAIGVGMSAKDFGGKFFGQGATMNGVIETPQEMTPDGAKNMARSWDRTHSGANSHRTGVLVGGATWKPTQLSNEQSQFLETQGYTASEIAAQMFLIDPAEMGLPVQGSSLTYANLEQRNARKVQVTFLPWIVRLEAFLTGLLPRPQYVKLNVNGLLRGDTKTRFDAYAVGINNRFMVPNEARSFEDWKPLPGGDEVTDRDTAPPEGDPNDDDD